MAEGAGRTHTLTSNHTYGRALDILGRGDRSWDWPHVELPSSNIGFGTIEEAVARGKDCLASGATIPCNFPPHLPASLSHALVQ